MRLSRRMHCNADLPQTTNDPGEAKFLLKKDRHREHCYVADRIIGRHRLGGHGDTRPLGIGVPVFISNIYGIDQRLKGYGSHSLGSFMGFMFAKQVWLDG